MEENKINQILQEIMRSLPHGVMALLTNRVAAMRFGDAHRKRTLRQRDLSGA
jgi:hypothetical protein